MRALLNGQRTASPLQVLGLLAVTLLLLTAFSLTFAYRGQLIALKHVIYGRCQQRLTYDTAAHNSVGADVRNLRYQLAQAIANKPEDRTLIQAFPAAQQPALRRDERLGLVAIRSDLKDKEAAYAQGVIGNCKTFH